MQSLQSVLSLSQSTSCNVIEHEVEYEIVYDIEYVAHVEHGKGGALVATYGVCNGCCLSKPARVSEFEV